MREDGCVTVDEEIAEQGPPDPARAALERHVASMRRQRWWYLAVIAVVAAVGIAVAVAVWFTGEITHVHLRTAANPPPSVPLGNVVAQPTLAWHSADASAIGFPLTGGTVVTYSRHTVTGRDALSGRSSWSYTRSDRTVCTAVQAGGNTLAIYAKDGNCDEVTTLDTATGKRQWERTLTDNGHPTYQVSPYTLLIVSERAVHAIDPASGLDRWNYQEPDGCLTRSAVLGTAGTLISQRCADGDHLALHDPNAGDDSKDPKPIKWRLAKTSTVPVAADSFVGAVDPKTGQLVTYDATKGTVVARTALTPRPGDLSNTGRVAASHDELVWLGTTVYALNSSGEQSWAVPADALPTLTAPDGLTATPDLGGAIILMPTATGVAALNGGTGRITAQYAVPAPPKGSQVLPLGNGLLVVGSSTTAYR
jgi:outer membrane protein assembly factor BamB